MFLCSAIELSTKVNREIIYYYKKLHKQSHGRILNMSLHNLTRKNESIVDVKMEREESFLSSLTPKQSPPTHLTPVVLTRFMLPALYQDLMQY